MVEREGKPMTTRPAPRRIALACAVVFAVLGTSAVPAGSARGPGGLRQQLLNDVTALASDTAAGRPNNTPQSLAVQQWLISQLTAMGAVGANDAATGDDAFKQAIPLGTNIVGIIPGGALANEYVIVGAHYDHLGVACSHKDATDPTDVVCNGATDNATGVANVLAIGREIARRPNPPKRSVILALWDREEDGLLGSQFYVNNPLRPLAQAAAYVNYDIQGANLLPSLRRTTFAVGSESGGAVLQSIVTRAGSQSALRPHLVSSIFGQGRSDYVNFIGKQVPTVFYSDSTGRCYHTNQDEVRVVDFGKLQLQARMGERVVKQLINGPRPSFVGGTPTATYDDAVAIRAVVHDAEADQSLFTAADQATLLAFREQLDAMVAGGPANFGSDDVGALLAGAASAISLLTTGECDGFVRGR
jgi:hypothetical protein